ncbi:MAG: substrate-binding domain-containing protein [Myxococcales bacterium]|nr:substrate-binding domain-containing protein [Myxococcales bacterium]
MLLAAAVLVALCLYAWFMWKRLAQPYEGPPTALLGDARIMREGFRERCGRPTNGDEALVVEVLHSRDTAAWVGDAAERFMRDCPNTQLRLRSIGDMDAVRSIVDGEVEPALWLPSSSLASTYLRERWEAAGREVPLAIDEGVSLLRSPTVLFVWEDRYRVLAPLIGRWDASGAPWARSLCASIPLDAPIDLTTIRREAMVPGTWLAWKRERFGGSPSERFPDGLLAGWGRVRIEHSSPTRTAVGLAAIYLMAYDFANVRHGLTLDSPEAFERALYTEQGAFTRWIRRCEAGLEYQLESTQELTERMFHVSGAFDGVVTSEQLAFTILRSINAHGPSMRRARIVYPDVTIVSDHPAVLFWPGPGEEEESAAAERFVEFLRSAPRQRAAVEHGFRPTNPGVVIRDYDVERNPFLRLRAFGVDLNPPMREPPRVHASTLRELVERWEDATERN